MQAPDGEILVDYRARLPGRGAWVTPTRENLERLEAKPALVAKTLKGRVNLSGLLDKVRAANLKAVEDLLSLAARSGVLVGGKDGLRSSLAGGHVVALLLAADISPRRGDDLVSRAGQVPVFHLHLDSGELGHRVGKGPRAALTLRPSKISRTLITELRRSQGLR